ncbi:MAG TPA: phytanoyl-CoA dioxygenase family protein [Burkholderiales bacterium]
MTLDDAQRAAYRRSGHLTVAGVFPGALMETVIEDIERWGEAFLADLPPDRRAWYVDGGVKAATVLRKLDNPHRHRDAVASLARDARLVGLVEALIGSGVSVYFSQIFFKPPGGGGPKTVHQDNFYFGPRDPDGLVTAWIALDDATPENGCLYFGEGTQRGPVHPHIAPPGQPFELHVPADIARRHPMTPAPVPRGGVSFHHGTTFHQSGPNLSTRWRRACALHYVRNDNRFVAPALEYDHSIVMRVS